MSKKATEKKIGLPLASVAKQRDENRPKQHFLKGMSRQSHHGKSLETSTMITQQATLDLDREDQNQGLIDTAVNVPEKPTLECHSATSKPSSNNVSPLGAESIVQIHAFTERRITMMGLGEEINQDMCKIMTTANGNCAKNQKYVRHISCCIFQKRDFFKSVLKRSVSAPKQVNAERDLICIDDQNDRSVKVTLPNHVQIQIEAAAMDEMNGCTLNCDSNSSHCGAKIICSCLEKQFDYMGDDESKVLKGEKMGNGKGNLKKVYRKKLGVYPQYRIRLNGVPWRTVDSSDEDTDHETTVQRGSKKIDKKNKKLKDSTTIDASSTSYGDGDGEESDPVHVIHVVSSMKRKCFKKRKNHYKDYETTTSEASDKESLTDCSLCLSDN